MNAHPPIRGTMTRRYRYNRMTGAQLSAALNQVGLTMRQACRVTGATEKKFEEWLTDREDIPHHILVIFTLLTLPGAMERAKAVTDLMVKDELS